MLTGDTQDSLASGRHLFLYDGACGLCSRAVQAVLTHDRRAIFHFAALQGPRAAEYLTKLGVRRSDMDTFIVIVNYRTSPSVALIKGAAAVFVLAALGWPWRAAAMLGVLPGALLDATYDLIARNRYRLVRRPEHCFVPRP